MPFFPHCWTEFEQNKKEATTCWQCLWRMAFQGELSAALHHIVPLTLSAPLHPTVGACPGTSCAVFSTQVCGDHLASVHSLRCWVGCSHRWWCQRDEATRAKCPSPSVRCGARENTVQRGMSLCLPTPYPHGHLGIILIFTLRSLLKSWVTTACQAKPDLFGLSKYYLCFQ